MDAPCVLGGKLADATPCQVCTLKLLKSGITAKMKGNLVTVQLALVLWFGGSQKTKRVGSNPFVLAQTAASSGTETHDHDM